MIKVTTGLIHKPLPSLNEASQGEVSALSCIHAGNLLVSGFTSIALSSLPLFRRFRRK